MKPVSLNPYCALLLLLLYGVLVPKNLTAGSKPNKQADSLVFRIIPVNSSLPSGSKFISIEVELSNTSQKTVRITPVGIGTQVSIAYRGCSMDDGFRDLSTNADPFPDFRATKVISIPPGGTYRQIRKIELEPDFFKPGMYRMSMYFSGSVGGRKDVFTGDLESNEVFFEIDEPENTAKNTPST
jgi:hypothetical protein